MNSIEPVEGSGWNNTQKLYTNACHQPCCATAKMSTLYPIHLEKAFQISDRNYCEQGCDVGLYLAIPTRIYSRDSFPPKPMIFASFFKRTAPARKKFKSRYLRPLGRGDAVIESNRRRPLPVSSCVLKCSRNRVRC